MRVKVLYSAPPRPQFGEVLRLFVVDPSGPVVRAVRAGEVVELAEFGRYERALLAQGKLAEVVERIDPVDLFVAVPTETPDERSQVEKDAGSPVMRIDAPMPSVDAPKPEPSGKLYVDDIVAAAGLPTASHPSEVTAPPAQKRRPGRPRKSRPE